MRRSNIITGIFNVIILLYAILTLALGIKLRHSATTACDHTAERQLIGLGGVLFVFSVAGIIGACWRVRWLLWLYLVVLVILIVLLLGSMIFLFVVTGKGDGESLSGKAYKEYRLRDYSNFMQTMVKDGWTTRKSCLVDGKDCKSLIDDKSLTVNQFYAQKLSSIQSGCCKPSNDCGFTFVAPTNWTKPTTTTTYSNSDCALWNNNESVLCYDCDACKAGVVQDIKVTWRKAAFIYIALVAFLFIVLTFGCYAVRGSDDYHRPGP